jgi:hypothetical protein
VPLWSSGRATFPCQSAPHVQFRRDIPYATTRHPSDLGGAYAEPICICRNFFILFFIFSNLLTSFGSDLLVFFSGRMQGN